MEPKQTETHNASGLTDGVVVPPTVDHAPVWSLKGIYTALVILPVAAFIWILFRGQSLPEAIGIAAATNSNTPAAQAVLKLPIFLAQIAIIIATARIFGAVMKRLGQPQVIGEMIAGLALGPSLLGALWPDGYNWLFPAGTVRFLNALSQLGIVLFMFLVGLELDLSNIRARGRHILVISHAGMALPLLGGGLLALVLYRNYSTADTSFLEFALFFGCAMSVTAFPVLARILTERGLAATVLGNTAMACAAIADVTAWALLALSVSIERGADNAATALWQLIGGSILFLGVMFFGVRRALEFWWRKRSTSETGQLSRNEFSIVLLLVLLSALATELLNAHAIFGAFVAGVIMPRDNKLRSAIESRLEDILVVLLLPLFFAYTGLRTNVGLISSGSEWGIAALILTVAIAGKLGGSLLAARASGIHWREAGALGVLMNARGLMELVILAIGLQDGIITPALFTMMVIMAVGTTMMTSPILAWLAPTKKPA